MAYKSIIEDDQGDELGWMYTIHDKYLFPDDSQKLIRTLPAWCHTCRRFTPAEELKPAEYYEEIWRSYVAEKDKLQQGAPNYQACVEPFDLLAAVWRRYTVQWRLALESRGAPGKCLECGTNNWVAIRNDGEWNPHPGAEGIQVRVQLRWFHNSLQERGRLYDLQGNRMPDRYAD